MSKLDEKSSVTQPPDRQMYDEVKIYTEPRYKESGLSGDEWRISAVLQLFYKGQLVAEERYRDVETALQLAYSFYCQQILI